MPDVFTITNIPAMLGDTPINVPCLTCETFADFYTSALQYVSGKDGTVDPMQIWWGFSLEDPIGSTQFNIGSGVVTGKSVKCTVSEPMNWYYYCARTIFKLSNFPSAQTGNYNMRTLFAGEGYLDFYGIRIHKQYTQMGVPYLSLIFKQSVFSPTEITLIYQPNTNLVFLKVEDALMLCLVNDAAPNNFQVIGEVNHYWDTDPSPSEVSQAATAYALDYNNLVYGVIPVAPDTPVDTNSETTVTTEDMNTIGGGFESGDVAVLTPNNTPTYGADAGGCIITYVPTETEMTAFKQEVNDVSFWQNWLASNGLKDIIGCMILPFSVTGEYVSTGGIWIGGIHLDCNMHMTENSYRDLDFGTIDISNAGTWGNFLDYEPYTVCTIHLPFVGKVPVASSDIIGHRVGVLYRVNIVTGDFVAFITSDHENQQVIRYEYYGNLASSVPLTQNDFTNTKRVLTAGLGLITSVAVAGLTGGAGAGAVLNGIGAIGSKMGTGALLAEAGIGAGIGAFASNYCSRDSVKMQGNFSSQTSIISSRQCYLEIETVDQKIYPEKYREMVGFPSNTTTTLENVSGFNKVSVIHLDGVPATNTELTELDSLLKGGVVIK